jgi:hypothetical protein
LNWTDGAFSAQIAPFDVPQSQTMLDEDFQRSYELTASNMTPGQYVSSDYLYGAYTETLRAVDRAEAYLDRTIPGEFLLIRSAQKVKQVSP